MAMNRYGYLDYRKLEVGDQVYWEHPVTGKVYDFEVTEIDRNDDWQPVELQLLDDLEHENEIIVSEYAEFPFKGAHRWPYISNRSYKDRYRCGIPDDSITLDRLFYTSMHHVPKSAETEEIENGRILAHRTLMEDLTTVEGDGSSESVLVPEISNDPIAPSIPSVTELSEILHISSMDFKTMVVKGLAEAIKQGKNFIELPPVLIEMHKEELLDLGYEVRFSAIYWDHLD